MGHAQGMGLGDEVQAMMSLGSEGRWDIDQ
jgi:hypothetical protein